MDYTLYIRCIKLYCIVYGTAQRNERMKMNFEKKGKRNYQGREMARERKKDGFSDGVKFTIRIITIVASDLFFFSYLYRSFVFWLQGFVRDEDVCWMVKCFFGCSGRFLKENFEDWLCFGGSKKTFICLRSKIYNRTRLR